MVRLGVGDQEVPVPSHIGLFYDGPSDRRRLQLLFLRPAIDDPRECATLVGTPGIAESLLRELETDLGRSLAPEIRSGRVRLPGYVSDPDELLERIWQGAVASTERGCDVIRTFSEIGIPGTVGFPFPEDHRWAESRINVLLSGTRAVVMCAYDVSTMPAEALTSRVLETHPLVVIGDRLSINPSYVEPSEYIRSVLGGADRRAAEG